MYFSSTYFHQSKHREIRLSLRKAVASTKHDFICQARVSVRLTHSALRVLSSSGARHRGEASSRSRHDAADRVAKAADDGFALACHSGSDNASIRHFIKPVLCLIDNALLGVHSDQRVNNMCCSPTTLPFIVSSNRSAR